MVTEISEPILFRSKFSMGIPRDIAERPGTSECHHNLEVKKQKEQEEELAKKQKEKEEELEKAICALRETKHAMRELTAYMEKPLWRHSPHYQYEIVKPALEVLNLSWRRADEKRHQLQREKDMLYHKETV